MTLGDEIHHKTIAEAWVISHRVQLGDRNQLPEHFQDLRKGIPEEAIVGSPFCILQFITSIKDGYDAQVCFPVQEGTRGAQLLPGLEVLSLTHQGSVESIGESYRILYARAAEQGIISDEFCREIYPDLEGGGIEIQFVIHPWEKLLEGHLERVLGSEKSHQILAGRDRIDLGSSKQERFDWVQNALVGLEKTGGEGDCYEILSRCAHVFPLGQIAKLRQVYLHAEKRTGNRLAAVDAVLDFMEEDPGWGDRPNRIGDRIYSTKKPRDPAAYEKAETLEEKKSAYCFCPLIRDNLEGGMSPTFCNCGAGWYRQQWEGVFQQPIRVEIIHSLLQGDDRCEFAVLIPDIQEQTVE